MLGHIKEILEFTIIELNNFKLTVASLVTLAIILVVGHLLVRLIQALIKRSFKKRFGVHEGKAFAFSQIAKYAIYVITLLIAIDSLGINLSLLVASSAALFVGIGLGLQNIFNDIVSGLFLLFEHSFEVGDVVEMDGLVGKVLEINVRTSTIRTRDNIVIIIPNSKLIANNIINWSQENIDTRFTVSVGVAYGSDVRKVEKILIQCAKEHPEVKNEPHSFTKFVNFGDSSLDFELVFWTDAIWEVELIESDLRFAINKAFEEQGVTIPFPQRDVHLKQ